MRWKKPEPRPATYWRPWFAWYPAKLENTGETVWLEWVWRHTDYLCGFDGGYPEHRHRDDISWGGANLEHRQS